MDDHPANVASSRSSRLPQSIEQEIVKRFGKELGSKMINAGSSSRRSERVSSSKPSTRRVFLPKGRQDILTSRAGIAQLELAHDNACHGFQDIYNKAENIANLPDGKIVRGWAVRWARRSFCPWGQQFHLGQPISKAESKLRKRQFHAMLDDLAPMERIRQYDVCEVNVKSEGATKQEAKEVCKRLPKKETSVLTEAVQEKKELTPERVQDLINRFGSVVIEGKTVPGVTSGMTPSEYADAVRAILEATGHPYFSDELQRKAMIFKMEQ